ncbi:MAG: chalcone isomerase family protein [Cocleimonas sp.]|nr:chalcone isomerase family protein [Cocleimonas sp.]
MRTVNYIMLWSLFFVPSSAYTYSYSGGSLTYPNKMLVNGQSLVLNGTGFRTKVMIRLYSAGLYLRAKSANGNDVMMADETMAIRIKIISPLITSEQILNAIKQGFKHSMGGKTEALQKEIDHFSTFFQKTLTTNDVIDLVYTSATGIKVISKGEVVTTIKSLAFKKALFGIWLSNLPAQESLKNEMLDNHPSNLFLN